MKAKTDKDIYIVVINGKTFEVKNGVIEAEDSFKEELFSLGFVEIFEEAEVEAVVENTKPVTIKKGKKNG